MQIPLSSREKQLLRRLAWGRSDAVIAAEIGGTKKQIASQRERLLAKLCITSSQDLARAAKTLIAQRQPPFDKIGQ